MFNKEGIPFFIIVIPFLSILFVSFLSISYYLKLSNETYQTEINEYKRLHLEKLSDTQIINNKEFSVKPIGLKIENIEKGDYILMVQKPGYKHSETRFISIDENGITHTDTNNVLAEKRMLAAKTPTNE